MKIYIDRLRGGQIEKISSDLEPTFLGITEKELIFAQNIEVRGEAYLAEDHLVIRFDAKTCAKMPCAICSKTTEVPLLVKEFTHTVELTEIPSSIYDCMELIREAILLQIPAFLECTGGKCPDREAVNKYLRKPSASAYHPFKNLS